MPLLPANSEIDIRAATSSDLEKIVHMLWDDPVGRTRESIQPEHQLLYANAFSKIDDGNNTLLVAIKGGRLIGFVQLTIITSLSYRGSSRGLIEDLRVAQELRGRGIGSLLMDRAEAIARAKGCTLMELFAHNDRDGAHRFYQRRGYVGAHRGFRKTL